MFVTDAGSVLGAAEMLSPVSSTQQPFRFVSLAVQDRRRLESIIPVSVYHDITEPDWMKKLRAVSEDRYAPPPSRVKLAVLAVSLMALGLAGATFFLHVPLLKWIGK
jgi:UDP:flavonoid glycosyltransferase YjiC (YdhE family)